jgi:hypothetical protein
MEDLSLHILDIAENSRKAGAQGIGIAIQEDSGKDLLTIEITDDGEGMDDGAVARAADPFFTSRTERRVGLGLPLLAEAARAAGGSMNVLSTPGKGTTVIATFQLGHIDRKPLGKMAETITSLIAGWPEVNLTYLHERDGQSVSFSTADVRLRLGGMPLNSIEILDFILRFLAQEEDCLPHIG